MSDDSSEEKTEKGTPQKLRKERERGRALTAADTVAAAVVAVVLMALAALAQRIAAEFSLLFDASLQAGGKPQIESVRAVWMIFGRVVAGTALILLGLASCIGILATLAIKKGFVFSTENISPKFERLNPAANLKNMFAQRALIEFALAAVRFLAWVIAATLLIVGYMPALIAAVSLDVPTTLRLFILVFASFLVLAILFMALTSGTDLPTQRYLFEVDMRMTRTEVRREYKDSYGDPHLVAERKRQAKAALNNPIGIRKTSFIAIGVEGAVGIHYVYGKTDVPSLTLRVDRSGVGRLRANATKLGIPVVRNNDLVRLLASGFDVGEALVGQELVGPFTDAFVASVSR